MDASLRGADVGILPLPFRNPNPRPSPGRGTVLGGQFDWGGRLPESNGGAQRYPQIGWKPIAERNCRRVLDCKAYKPSRDESRK